MKFFRSSVFVSLLSAGLIACAQVPPAPTVGKWDFAYQISGGQNVGPVQVFDDGEGKTYFQFREGQVIPTIIGASGKILIPQRVGPYMVVDGAERDYTLSLGMARSHVVHTSVASGVVKAVDVPESLNGGAPKAPLQAASAASVPTALSPPQGLVLPRKSYRVRGPEAKGDWSQNSYATPLRGDATAFVSDEPVPKPKPKPKSKTHVAPRAQVVLPSSGAFGGGTSVAASTTAAPPCACDHEK
jgi:hypothetical protein